MKQVRAAIVGMGIGRVNGRAIAKNPRARIVAICDLIESRMADFAKELPEPVKQYVDYKEMYRDREIDAVFVGTPNQVHVPVAMEAVRRGKHVLVTKPLADRLPPARRLVEAAEASGLVNMMSLSTRFDAPVRYLRRMADAGEFGRFYYARARSIRRSGIPDWNLGFLQAGGGAFRDMGVHVLDTVWWLLGMPQPVSVAGVGGAKFGPRGRGYWDFHPVPPKTSRQFAADDYAGGMIRFDGGIGVQVESFWASHQPEEFQIELFGTEAGARLSPLTVYRTADGAPQDITIAIPRGPEVWDTIAAHFIECILDGVKCTAPLRHGLIVQEMMEAMLVSGRTGKEVRLGKARG